MTARVKELEHGGYTFEAADASFELLLMEEAEGAPSVVLRRRVVARHHRDLTHASPGRRRSPRRPSSCGRRRARTSSPARATVRSTRSTRRCGTAIVQAYPAIAKFELIDFKVRILDQGHGTDAITRVLIETSDGESSWVTVGVGANVIEASWEALVDGLTYGLVRHHVE